MSRNEAGQIVELRIGQFDRTAGAAGARAAAKYIPQRYATLEQYLAALRIRDIGARTAQFSHQRPELVARMSVVLSGRQ